MRVASAAGCSDGRSRNSSSSCLLLSHLLLASFIVHRIPSQCHARVTLRNNLACPHQKRATIMLANTAAGPSSSVVRRVGHRDIAKMGSRGEEAQAEVPP